ncbi:DUF397 domain-containing protein [Streptomyces sp. NBC_00239]|nr:DUF397 domain-containing protein [Streptomyces sp. NBC_00239]
MAESTIAQTFAGQSPTGQGFTRQTFTGRSSTGQRSTGRGKRQLDLSTAQWQPGGRGAGEVQIAFVEGFIALRTSVRPGRPPLVLAPREWRAFVRGARVGRFDPA